MQLIACLTYLVNMAKTPRRIDEGRDPAEGKDVVPAIPPLAPPWAQPVEKDPR
jgi:hypothetical protein